MNNEIRLNLGCASRPLPGYVNIDLDSKEQILIRYPGLELPEEIEIHQYDIFNLPFDANSVDEVRSESMLEHLSFEQEKLFFYEMKRVLKIGGELIFSVPDFEETVREWLDAKDDWKDFYRNDSEAIAQQHWFGTYSYGTENRWGYLIASIFGPQNSEGQYHKNAYTKRKIISIMDKLDFQVLDISTFLWKGDRNPMLLTRAKKIK